MQTINTHHIFMKKHLFLLTSLALGMAACTDADLKNEQGQNPEGNPEEVKSNLTTVNLATFGGDPSRVSYAGTRAEGDEDATPKTLELIATITNPSKSDGFDFIKEDGGRFLSATSVYYDPTWDTYYATYHMQGNNYNTNLQNEIGGAIQTFKLVEDEDGELTVDLGDGFRAANPNKEDFDFNHLYFDVTDRRIIAVGHKWNVPSSWAEENGDYPGKRENTRAIIALFDPTAGQLKYKTISTNKKIIDPATGQSLGDEDAGDANCVIRGGETMNPNHTSGWNFYHVATRKGMAVLRAEADHLFEPVLNEDGSNYFIKTPGSAKFVAKTGTSSFFDLLYLAEDKSADTYDTQSNAKIAHFSTQVGEVKTLGYVRLKAENIPFDPQNDDILNFSDQTDLPAVITPIDGKNTLLCAPDTYNDKESYAALGVSGLFYHFDGVNSYKPIEGILKFKGSKGYLPVNCVTADVSDMESGHDGFMYVACGARLVILHRKTFEVVAYWNIPTKDGNGNFLEDVEASANYIHVQKGPAKSDRSPRERIITVAFGQEGLKVFRFDPSTLEKKTVWEKELPTEIVCK